MKSFAIKFKNDCYFITSSDDPLETFNEFVEKGYFPVGIESIIEDTETYLEWALFRKYLNLYGIEKVRGASYTEWILTSDQQAALISLKQAWDPLEKRDKGIISLTNALNNCKLVQR